MILAKVSARANETFIIQASLTIITYDCQNIFIVQATGLSFTSQLCKGVIEGEKEDHSFLGTH